MSCFFGVVALAGYFISSTDAYAVTCKVNATHGCMHNEQYEIATSIPCGPNPPDQSAPVYDKRTKGCCSQGVVFALDQEFCCYTDIIPIDAGKCVKWNDVTEKKYPECYDCTDNPSWRRELFDKIYSYDESAPAEITELEDEEKIITEDDIITEVPQFTEDGHRALAVNPIDTLKSPSPSPCTEIDDQQGCLNTWSYYYFSEFPCGKYLLPYSTFGCCNGVPYRWNTQTCCHIDGQYQVKNTVRYCTCYSYQCFPTAVPTSAPSTHAPTGTPSFPPSPVPTITYRPTNPPSAVPTSIPTISHQPTIQVSTKAAEDVFDMKFVYWGGGLGVALLAAFTLFQWRATRLIKKRQEVIMELSKM